MELQLNQYVEEYKPFPGRNTEQMPLLIAEGRTPISVSGLYLKRLKALKSKYFSEIIKDPWLDGYFDPSDGFASHQNGKVKVVLDVWKSCRINEQSPLMNGALILSGQEWKDLKGLDLTGKQAEKYFKDSFTEAQVNRNPIHQFLARDKNILKEYSHEMFALMKHKFNCDKCMGLYKTSAEIVPTVRLCEVGEIEDGSAVGGRCGLVDDDGYLVGVLQGIAEGNSQKTSLEQRLIGKAIRVDGLIIFEEGCFTSEELKSYVNSHIKLSS